MNMVRHSMRLIPWLCLACSKVIVEETIVENDDDDGIAGAPTVSTTGSGGTGGQGGDVPDPPECPPFEVAHDTENEWWEKIVVSNTEEIIARYVVTNTCDRPRDARLVHLALLDETKPSTVSAFQLFDLDGHAISEPVGPPMSTDTTITIPEGMFTIPARESATFDVHAYFADVNPSHEGDADWARSGDRIRVALDELQDEDDVPAILDDTFVPPFYVLRASAPQMSIDNDMDPLTEGVNTIFRMNITNLSDDHATGLRQIVIKILTSTELTVTDEGINAFLLNGEEITNTLSAEIHEDPPFGGTAILTLPNDVLVNPNDELTLELQAIVSGVTMNSFVAASLDATLAEFPANMQLNGTAPPGLLTLIPAPPYEGPSVSSGIIWTDFAEADIHTSAAPSSFDYYSLFLLPGAAGTSVSNAP